MNTFRTRIRLVIILAVAATILAILSVAVEWNVEHEPDLVIATIALVWATIILGLATLGLALVAFHEIEESRQHGQRAIEAARQQNEAAIAAGREQTDSAIEAGRKQNEELRQASSRPLIIPDSLIEPDELWGYFQPNLKVINVGTGVATNIHAVIFPPAPQFTDENMQLAFRIGMPLAANKSIEQPLLRGNTFLTPSDKIGDVSLAPDDKYSAARLTLTYMDVFGFKHASVFDVAVKRGWIGVTVINGIPQDLEELNNSKPLTEKEISESKDSSVGNTTIQS